jgi:NMD protein affecting ribosome stability and mRNA decay
MNMAQTDKCDSCGREIKEEDRITWQGFGLCRICFKKENPFTKLSDKQLKELAETLRRARDEMPCM